MGLEVSGVVKQIGSKVTDQRFAIGDRVCALLPGGGYAQQAIVRPELAMPIPEGVTMDEAASLPEVFATAWLNLVGEANLQAGETVFIHAGASGVGIAAIQIAKHLGAYVVTSVGGQKKVQAVKQLGVDRIIDHHQEDVGKVLEELKDEGRPVNVVLDCVGGMQLGEHIPHLAMNGRWILIATLGGPKTMLNLRAILTRRLRLIGSTLRSRTPEHKAQIISQLTDQLWPKFTTGQIKPMVYKTLSILHADEAHTILKRRENIGKVVLSMQA
jgi:NADPH2:quinone reductase